MATPKYPAYVELKLYTDKRVKDSTLANFMKECVDMLALIGYSGMLKCTNTNQSVEFKSAEKITQKPQQPVTE